MYRVALDNVGAHRTCTPLHEKHQATPYATFLSEAETDEVFSGQVMAKDGEDTVRLADADDAAIVGLAALDRNNTIDDLEGQGGAVPFAVWQGGPDAYFEVDAPAFDDQQAYAVPTDGTREELFSNASGQLTPVSGTGPAVAELIEVVSESRIIVRLLAN